MSSMEAEIITKRKSTISGSSLSSIIYLSPLSFIMLGMFYSKLLFMDIIVPPALVDPPAKIIFALHSCYSTVDKGQFWVESCSLR